VTLAADYSLPSIRAQSRAGRARYLNLNDRHGVLEFAMELMSDSRPVHFIFQNVLEGLGGEGKSNSFLLLRWALRNGGTALMTVDTNLPLDHEFEDPTSWHLPVPDLLQLAELNGLSAEITWKGQRTDAAGRQRSAAHVILRQRQGGEA
jgi:hypothetical protein